MLRLVQYALVVNGLLFLFWFGAGPLIAIDLLGIGQLRDKATAELDGLKVTIERRYAHAFLAESHRTLIVEQPGGGAIDRDLGMDTGSLTRVRVCRSEAGGVLIHGFRETYEAIRGDAGPVVTAQPSLEEACPEPLGAFDVDEEHGFGFKPG